DALCRIPALDEDPVLDGLDVSLQRLGHRSILVDDRVEDAPDDRGGPALEELGALLQAPADLRRIGGRAVADRDDVSRSDEQLELPELNLFLPLVVSRGPKHDEVEVVVALDLWSLVCSGGVLHRQLVQVKPPAQLLHELSAGLMHLQPDETAAAARTGRSLLDRHLPEVLAHSANVMGAVDDHRGLLS